MDFTKKIHGVTWILYHQTVKTLKLYGEQTATFLLWLESRYNTVRYAILLHSHGNLTLLYMAVILRVSVSCLVYNLISWARYVKLWWLVVNRQWGIIWSNYHPDQCWIFAENPINNESICFRFVSLPSQYWKRKCFDASKIRVSVSCLVYNLISWARYVKLWWLVVNRQWGIIWSNYHPDQCCHAGPSGYNESKLKTNVSMLHPIGLNMRCPMWLYWIYIAKETWLLDQ